MVRDVGTCRPEDQASAAAKIMWERDCGSGPVVEDGSWVIGVVTDRDLCMASFLEGRLRRDISVRRGDEQGVVVQSPQDDLSTAEHVMGGGRATTSG